ncbi:SRPBCC family protein [Pseudarthrobacter sp. YS3]|uniref:SRPBCC family protein n=1 Tax=Pseudarthrobacter sp. YS3 TaxID=3453718 RepID=UPI003EEFD983
MTTIKGSILIRRPVEEVFDFVADERNEPAYNPQLRSVEKTTPGPIGAGTLWHVVATSGKRSTPFALEVTKYTRPSRLESMTRMATADINGALTFVPDASGTRMSWSWDLGLKGMLKLATPPFAAVGRRQEQRIWSSLK